MQLLFFEELLILLTSALFVSIALLRLKIPTIVAYICVGALVGPTGLNLIKDPNAFSLLAEFGVAFLLFSLGLEFSVEKLWQLRRSVFGIGGIQVSVCCLLFAAAVYIWGASLESAIIIAGALALSSTAIVSKELQNQNQLSTRSGGLTISVLLFQDLAAILFLILIPVFAGQNDMSLGHSLGIALAKGVVLFVVLMSIGKWVLPFIYKEVEHGGSDEIFVLSTLVICLLSAWLTHLFHLSMALGSFVIGMMLSESPFKRQIEIDIRSFKHILLSLFFVTIGLNIDLTLIPEYWPRIIIFTLALIMIKTVVIASVVVSMREKGANAIRVGLCLAQAGEFGIALVTLAKITEILPPEQASFIVLIATLSMMISPWMIRYVDTMTDMAIKAGLKIRP